jgi:hypothetical protein
MHVDYFSSVIVYFLDKLVIFRIKRVCRDDTPIYKTALKEIKGSSYDGSLCDRRPGTNYVVGVGLSSISMRCI